MSRFVFETGDHDFRTAVVERSREVPVLVDFWAPWCGPCRILGPILEKLAEEFQGAFLLAKVNTDENPGLAEAFQIRSIPTVHLVADGRGVDGFQGALPEAQVRGFLQEHVKVREPEDPLADAEALLAAGEPTRARRLLERVVEKEPAHARANLQLARLDLADGNEEAAEKRLEAIPADAPEAKDAQHLRDAKAFHSACGGGGVPEARKALDADPDDLDRRYRLGCCLAAAGQYGDALATFLEIVKRDRHHEDEAARKAMLTIFGILGKADPLVGEYRRQLVLHL